MKGKKRIPTEIKIAKGTLRPCRANPDEPQYPVVNGLPDPPEYFGKVAKSLYYSTGNILISTGVLKTVNLPLLVAYCKEFEVYTDAREKINSSSMVRSVLMRTDQKVWQINPYQKIANDSLSNMIRIACELGVTPASSSKVNAIKENKKDSIFD